MNGRMFFLWCFLERTVGSMVSEYNEKEGQEKNDLECSLYLCGKGNGLEGIFLAIFT